MILTVYGPFDEGVFSGFLYRKWDNIATKLTQNRKMWGHYKQDLMLTSKLKVDPLVEEGKKRIKERMKGRKKERMNERMKELMKEKMKKKE